MRGRSRVKESAVSMCANAGANFGGVASGLRHVAFTKTLLFCFHLLMILGFFWIRSDFGIGIDPSPDAGSGFGRDCHATYHLELFISVLSRTSSGFYVLGFMELDRAACPPNRIGRQWADDLNRSGRSLFKARAWQANSESGDHASDGPKIQFRRSTYLSRQRGAIQAFQYSLD